MRITAYSSALLALALTLGCGDSGTGTDPTTDATTNPSNATTGDAMTGTGTSGPTDPTATTAAEPTTGGPGTSGEPSTSTTDATTGGAVLLNECDAAMAEDHTADAETTVTQEGLAYGPKCIRIKAGASVKFVASFAAHPLVGGAVVDGAKVPDAGSPITMTNAGMEATFVFPAAGDFGYYCDIHALGGMTGAIFVE